MVSLEFLITSLIVVLVPGTGVAFAVSMGLIRGRKASLFAALGCAAGIVPHLLATVLGLAAVMHTSALAFQALKLAGVAYLFYLAVATWRAFRKHRYRFGGQGVSAQHPQSQAHPFFSRLFAAIREGRCPFTARSVAAVERRVHGHDVGGVRGLWLPGSCFPQSRHRITPDSGLAAARVCGRLCRAWRQPRFIGEMKPGLVSRLQRDWCFGV